MTGASRYSHFIAAAASTALLLLAACAPQIAEETAPVIAAEPVPPPPPPPPPAAAEEVAPPISRNIARKVGETNSGRLQGSAGNNRKKYALGSVIGRKAKTRAVKIGGIPRYPVWPPETPSSRVSLDRFIKARTNLSLHGAGQKLKAAFEDAGYLEYSYFSAPGGFVLVTRIEKINAKGDPLPGTERYKLPNQRSSGSLTSFVRGLFLDAPPGFYRYIAVVVSDQPYQTSRRSLSSNEALRRLSVGSNNLSAAYKNVAFTRDHNVEALIYEFTKNTRTGKVRMIAPGRLTPRIHLAKTKLNTTIAANFRR